jgi:hypothetical protein
VLLAERSLVQDPIRSFIFFLFIYLFFFFSIYLALPAALGIGVYSAPNIVE